MKILIDPQAKFVLFCKTKWVVSSNYWKPLLIDNHDSLNTMISMSNVLASFNTENDMIEGMSFNSFTNVRHGVRLDLWYYGENEKALLAHVVTCLQRALTVLPPCMLYFQLHFPQHFGYDFIHGELKTVLGELYDRRPFIGPRVKAIVYTRPITGM